MPVSPPLTVWPLLLAGWLSALPVRQAGGAPEVAADPTVVIDRVVVDGGEEFIPFGGRIRLPAGSRRLDFFFGDANPNPDAPIRFRFLLEGIDENWREASGGMEVAVSFLNEAGEIVDRQFFPASGSSIGWLTTPLDSPLTDRREPLLVPPGAVTLRIALSSGQPDTLGVYVIDDMSVNVPHGSPNPTEDLLSNSGFSKGGDIEAPDGTIEGWNRGGSDPSIAQPVAQSFTGSCIGLIDRDREKSGEWWTDMPLHGVKAGTVLSFAWREAYRIAQGKAERASFINVPAGNYTFRAAAIAASGGWTGKATSLRLEIPPLFWQRTGVAEGAVSLLVMGMAGAAFSAWRRRTGRRLRHAEAEGSLERERTRIARDIHDDLGASLTRLTHLAALTQRDLKLDPAQAAHHAEKIGTTASELVQSIEEIIWAVNPHNDTVDHLADYLCRFSSEFFRESPVRCRLAVPPVLPATPLTAEVRHALFLASKEALNNTLKHAGPCECVLGISVENDQLTLSITDTGRGFDPATVASGNGLRNLVRRLQEVGGSCRIHSGPGTGTGVDFSLPLRRPFIIPLKNTSVIPLCPTLKSP